MNGPDVFDSIVIGSGAGGAAAAYQLASAGLNVAIIEKGSALPRDASTLDFEKVVHQGAFKSTERWRDGDGREIVPEEYFNVGGKTKWYGAALLRFAPHEFAADDAHRCLAWPFRSHELAPWYDRAEQLLGVRQFETEPDLERILSRVRRSSRGWRSEPMPLGLHPQILQNRLEAGRFDGFASVAGLKADSETSFLSRVLSLPNVRLLTGTPVTQLLPRQGNPLRVAGVRLQDGRELHAGCVILAAGALHSPRLLDRYLTDTGVRNRLPSAEMVGRNLKLHLLTALVAISPSIKSDVIRKTAVLLNDSLPHSSVQPLGFDGELIGTLIPSLVPRSIARQIGKRAYGFFLQTEDGSHPDNRVIGGAIEPAGIPTLDYSASRLAAAEREHRDLRVALRRALGAAGMLTFSQRIGLSGTAHACGTLVAGNDPHRSVVDANGRVHGMESLYVVDGSVLPRSSRVNPSLTIYSWSLRVAHALAVRLIERQATSVRRLVRA